MARLRPRHVLSWALVSFGAIAAASCGSRTGLDYPGYWLSCTQTEDIVAAPIEIHVLLDVSHSMDDETSEGIPKWDAVRDALSAFIAAPSSVGLSVALTYFPRGAPEESEPCSEAQACSQDLAVCKALHFCFPSLTEGCVTDANCSVSGDTCHAVGICEAQAQYCEADNPMACGGTEPCVLQSTCLGGQVCQPAMYESPDVALDVLPDNVAPILASLSGKVTEDGGTPTLPALATVVEAAKQRALENPTHAVLVLLATDGFPTVCDPAAYENDLEGAIDHLVDVAESGNEGGARTFVVGVVAPDEAELAQENLDLVAEAGGTYQAWLVTTDGSLSEQFLAALEQLKFEAATCQLVLPDVPEGSPHRDLSSVRVRTVGPAGAVELPRVPSKSACSGDGYYFTAKGGPVRIVLCSESCTAAEGGRIEADFPCDWQEGGTL